jgi:hypothetical protein
MNRFYQSITIITLSFSSLALHGETLSEWGERALNIQNSIDHDAPFSETTWPGTHNSFANNEDDSFWDVALNQKRSRTQQMEKGIRQLVFDIHYSWSNLRLCHNNTGFGTCFNGITGYKRLKHGLEDIASFLAANPNEVILLKLELGDTSLDKLTLLASEFQDYVGSYIYGTTTGITTHGDLGSDGCTEFPTDIITKSKVLAAGKNLIIFSTKGCQGNSSYNDLAFYGGLKSYSSASDIENASDTDRREKLSRVFDGLVKGSASNGSSNDVKLQPNSIVSFLDAGLNLVETYGFDATGSDWKSDGEYPLSSHNMVWSWDDSGLEPDGTDNCVKLFNSTDRFRDATCSNTFYAACRKLVESDGSRAYDDWIITSTSVTFSNAESQCLSDGNGEYFFAVPRNKMELNTVINERNSAGLNAEDIWLNYEKNGSGEWIADIGEADNEMSAYCDNGGAGAVCGHMSTYLNWVQ